MEQDDATELDEPKPVEIVENRLAYVGIIIPMSILGSLIRVGLLHLETYDGAPVFGLVYAQWIGCFIMGIAVEKKSWLQYVYPPLQVGLSSGLCGSITTFSSWQRDIFEGFANYGRADHTTGHNILAAISQLLVTLAMSLNALIFGRHVAHALLPFDAPVFKLVHRPMAPWRAPDQATRKVDWAVILFGVASWIGVVVAAALAPQQRALAFACVFSPIGALLRWYLSAINTKYVSFMYGTFIANMLGTLVLAILSLAGNGVHISWIGCQVILGLADGFCGCLSTVSTFVASVELTSLPLRQSYIYGTTSVVVGQMLMFLVFGTFIWTQGINATCA